MNLNAYQKKADESNQNPDETTEGRLAVILGLVAEAGSVADLYKRLLRDHIEFEDIKKALSRELGDLLWFIATSAQQHGLKLVDIADENITRAHNRYLRKGTPPPRFDARFPEIEQFPGKMVFRLQEESAKRHRRPHVRTELVSATPNHFPDGPLPISGTSKQQGFSLPKTVGSKVNDNSSVPDQYRFHDAIHLAFVANLGWSPVMRGLLGLKRRSNQQIDDDEDGARAIHCEEAIAVALFQIAKLSRSFQKPEQVNEEVLDIIQAITAGHEVRKCLGWQWRDAIHQGFEAMRQLAANKGGYLTVDVANRKLIYNKMEP